MERKTIDVGSKYHSPLIKKEEPPWYWGTVKEEKNYTGSKNYSPH
jgi:hypothetical protein